MNFKFAPTLAIILISLAAGPVCAQSPSAGYNEVLSLEQLAETPAVSGYELNASKKIADALSQFHPVTDNLGNVIITIGIGSPHRLLAAPIDEPGYVVSEIRPDGYLRLRRMPSAMLPNIFNELYAAQPVKIATKSGMWINGVVAGLSIHLETGRVAPPDPRDIDNMYVDIGATSAEEARKAGVDILSPVILNQPSVILNLSEFAGPGVGDKFGAEAVMSVVQTIDPSKIAGTLTVAFVTQSWSGGRGLHRVLATTPCDEFLYVGRLLPSTFNSAADSPVEPHRKPGGSVMVGVLDPMEGVSGLGAILAAEARPNAIPIGADYSANPIDPLYGVSINYPKGWAHVGIATAWPNTPVETISLSDYDNLVKLLAAHYGVTLAPAKEFSFCVAAFLPVCRQLP